MKRNPLYQYIHFHKTGDVYVFYKIDAGLFVKVLRENHEFSNTKISDNVMEFAAEVDEKGIFHVVCLITNGELVYWKNHGFQWHHRILTKYDSTFYIFKGLKILLYNQNIHILVAISNELNPECWVLKHHYWNNTVWYNKKVCEIICGKYDHPFQGDMDNSHHIHVVYKSRQDGKSQIFYCKFNMVHNMWSTPKKINMLLHENSHPFIFCDSQNRVHLIWSGLENGNYSIYYRYNENTNIQRSYWSEMTKLSLGNSNCTHPLLLQCSDKLKIVWKQNDQYSIGVLDTIDKTVTSSFLLTLPSSKSQLLTSIIGPGYKFFHFVKIIHAYSFSDDDIYILGVDDIHSIDALPQRNSCQPQPVLLELDEDTETHDSIDDIDIIKMTRAVNDKFDSRKLTDLENINEFSLSGTGSYTTIHHNDDTHLKEYSRLTNDKDWQYGNNDMIIKIKDIEDQLLNVNIHLKDLTEQIGHMDLILASIHQLNLDISEEILALRNERSSVFRLFK